MISNADVGEASVATSKKNKQKLKPKSSTSCAAAIAQAVQALGQLAAVTTANTDAQSAKLNADGTPAGHDANNFFNFIPTVCTIICLIAATHYLVKLAMPYRSRVVKHVQTMYSLVREVCVLFLLN